MSGIAERQTAEPEPESGPGEDAAVGDAFAALAATARRLEALIGNGAERQPLVAMAMVRVAQATQAAEELRDALKSRKVLVRVIADDAFAAGAASRHLHVAG